MPITRAEVTTDHGPDATAALDVPGSGPTGSDQAHGVRPDTGPRGQTTGHGVRHSGVRPGYRFK